MARSPKKTAKPRKAAAAAFDVALVKLSDLTAYSGNAKVHSDGQVLEIVASIREFGFTNPIVADLENQGLIAAGHGRQLALEFLFAEGEDVRLPQGTLLPVGLAPVIDCSGWTDAQRRAYTLADNKIAENATWDEHLLTAEVAALLDMEAVDLSTLGFDTEELAALTAAAVPPSESPQVGGNIATEHECPKCGYKFSGGAKS